MEHLEWKTILFPCSLTFCQIAFSNVIKAQCAWKQSYEGHHEGGHFACFLTVDHNAALRKNQLQNGEHLIFQVEHHSFHVKTLVKIGVLDLTATKFIDIVVELYKNLLI